MPQMNQFESEDQLLDALRRLARNSSRAASAEVSAGLTDAFRRHHRRRRTRNAAIVLLAICCLASAAALLIRPQKAAPVIGKKKPSTIAAPFVPSTANTPNPPANAGTWKTAQHDARHKTPRRQRAATEARQSAVFLPLPSYDPAVAKGELQIIRVEMPIQDLRLVGAPVGADVPNRQVRADFVVGHDGTPYAVRLVQ